MEQTAAEWFADLSDEDRAIFLEQCPDWNDLDPAAQEGFAQDMGYNPTVKNAKVPEATQKRIGFTATEQQRLKDLDYAYIAKNYSALKEWWDKVFKG